MLRAVLFDFNGVLVDDEPIHLEMFQRVLAEEGVALEREAAGRYQNATELGRDLQRAIERFIDRGPELQRAAAVRGSRVRSMDEHFAELFERYEQIAPLPAYQPAPAVSLSAMTEVALARSAVRTS